MSASAPARPADARAIALPSYEITIAHGLLDRAGPLVRAVAPAHRYVIVSDETVAALYAARLAAAVGASDTLTIPAGESWKTRETWARLTDDLFALGAGRDTVLLALGGGVVGDLTGFVAATFMRGIPFVQLPTTLLAMIDASIGGKTGVDTLHGKNLVGAFHDPAAVLVDPDVLATLPPAQMRAGLAEAIKHGIIADADYLTAIERALPALVEARGDALLPLLARSVELKADVVRRDAREGGLRKILNFGHTLGHAIELESGFALLHGEAVAIGMVLESALAESLGVAEPGTAARTRAAVDRAGLPSTIPATIDRARVLAATHLDKKARRGTVEYALPRRVGAMAGESNGWSVAVDDDAVRTLLARSSA